MKYWIILLFLLVTACEDRERSNPLDPENHLSHGAPQGLKVITHRDTARVLWQPFEVDHLKSYVVYRGNDFKALDYLTSIQPEKTEFTDGDLDYDRPYYYAVQAITEYSQSAVSQAVKVIPGPVNVWVADMYGFLLRNISYDGTTITKEQEYSSPRSVEFDPGEKMLWVGDYYQRKIFGISYDFQEHRTLTLPSEPIALALDSLNQLLFTVLEDNNLYALDYAGSVLWQVPLKREVTLATELAYNSRTGNVWISLSATDEVLVVNTQSADKEPVTFPTVDNPGPLEADPKVAGVWVSTASGVARMDTSGLVAVYKSNLFIHDLSLDPVTGDCYYSGSLERFSNWETGFLDHNHPEQSTVILGDSISQVFNLQVVPGTVSAGILIQEARNHTLIRFDHSGKRLGTTVGYSSHLDFALDWQSF